MVWPERRIRCAPRERNTCASRVNDEAVISVAAEHAPDVPYVVEETRNEQVGVVVRFHTSREAHSVQNIEPDQRYEQRVFHVVIERIASCDAFECRPRYRA